MCVGIKNIFWKHWFVMQTTVNGLLTCNYLGECSTFLRAAKSSREIKLQGLRVPLACALPVSYYYLGVRGIKC